MSSPHRVVTFFRGLSLAPAVIVVLLWCTATAQPLYESAFTLLPTAYAPTNLDAGDVNGDGRADLAVTSYGAQLVMILTGDGDGTFTTGAIITGLDGPNAIRIGDMNGDTKPDLVVGSTTLARITILFGNGDGTFTNRRDIAVSGLPRPPIELVDMEGDGRLDVILCAGGNVDIVYNLGNDIWWVVQRALHNAPQGMAVEDVSGDGRPDIAVAEDGYGPWGPSAEVFLYDGNFGLTPPAAYYAPGAGYAPLLIDADGDGVRDLVLHTGAGVTSTFRGTGMGTFTTRTDAPGNYYRLAAAKDLTGDGRSDVVALNEAVYGLVGLTGGGFGAAAECATAAGPSAQVLVDVDADGRIDDVVATFYGLSLSRGNGDGTFGSRTASDGGPFPGALALADFDEDGRPDAALHTSGTLSIVRGNGDGTFQPRVQIGSLPVDHIVARDLNADGHVDLVTARDAESDTGTVKVEVYLGHGDGTFAGPATYAEANNYNGDLVVGDIDGDGPLDIVIATHFETPGFPDDPTRDDAPRRVLAWDSTYVVHVLRGVGDGTFVHGPDSPGQEDGSLKLADVDEDGVLDLIAANWDGGSGGLLQVRFGQGDGTFSKGAEVALADSPTSFASLGVGDMNGDGHVDACVMTGQGALDVFLGHGTGTFAPPVVHALSPGSLGLGLADVDGDGALDAITTNPRGTVDVLHGNGDGSLATAVAFGTGRADPGFAVGDVTGDGRLDVVVGRQWMVSLFTLVHSATAPVTTPPAAGDSRVALSLAGTIGARGVVSFRATLPRAAGATVRVYDARGRLTATVFDGSLAAGSQVVSWDATETPRGLYYALLTAGAHRATVRVVLPR